LQYMNIVEMLQLLLRAERTVELGTAHCGNIRNASFDGIIWAQCIYEIYSDLCEASGRTSKYLPEI